MSVKRNTPNAGESLVMSTHSFAWNGREIAVPSVADLEPVFGPPDRVDTTNPNKLLTWDSLGLYAYIEQTSKQVIAMAVAFESGGNKFRPTTAYAGGLVTPWGVFRASTTKADLLAAGFTESFGAHLSRIEATAGFFAELRTDGSGLVDFQICRNE